MWAGVRAQVPSPSKPSPAYAAANFRYPAWMSDDGVEIWTMSQTTTWRTVDDFANTTALRTFDTSVQGVRQLPDGELLVSTRGSAVLNGELWRTTGYTRANPTGASWSKVLTMTSPDCYIPGNWSMWARQGCAVVGEYGSKAGGGANARALYVSDDDGLTWRQIFDWVGSGLHIHGCAYDRYEDLVWAVFGDSQSGVAYTANWRDPAPSWTWVSTVVQPVGVYPLADRIVLGTDDTANGLYRIERSDKTTVVPAFRVDTSATLVTVSGLPFRRADSDSNPLLWPFNRVPGSTGDCGLLASYDGLTWHVLYRDSQTTDGLGMQTALGPSGTGKIIGYHPDGRNASGTVATFTYPSWSASRI